MLDRDEKNKKKNHTVHYHNCRVFSIGRFRSGKNESVPSLFSPELGLLRTKFWFAYTQRNINVMGEKRGKTVGILYGHKSSNVCTYIYIYTCVRPN